MIAIVITSGKGGVGKTTITANLGAALSLTDAKVLLLDGDAGLRNLDISLGLSQRVVFDAADVINNQASIEDTVLKKIDYPNLDLIAAPKDKDTNAYISSIKNMVLDSYDYLLIDSPAGIDKGFHQCMDVSDSAVLVVTPDVSSVRDAMTTKALIEKEYDIPVYIIVNRTRAKLARKGLCMSIKDVEEIMDCRILGAIPENDDLIKSSNLGIIVNKGKLNTAFTKIAKVIIDSVSNIQG